MPARVQFGRNAAHVDVPEGTSLLAAAGRAGVPLGQSCRGQGVCNSCRVRVDAGEGRLSPPTELELRWRLPNAWRLACQVRVVAPARSEPADEPGIIALWCPAWGAQNP